ncbi:MAG: hypothetical protein P4L84_19970 [Isosphaeraceae bacterium]|nr:hypothetical protein [Isosphaeraceae bacterium]
MLEGFTLGNDPLLVEHAERLFRERKTSISRERATNRGNRGT